MRRLATVLALAALAVLGASLGIAAPAFAHNVLESSNPSSGSQLDNGPSQVQLTFDLPIQQGDFDIITVIGPGSTRWEAGAATVQDRTISAPVRPLGPAGEYTIGYRILSADGHPVSGTVKFTLTKAGTGAPAAGSNSTESASATMLQTDQSRGSGASTWLWLLSGAVALAIGIFIALKVGRARQN